MVKRAVEGTGDSCPNLPRWRWTGRIEAYNLPLGTLSQLFRDIAGHRAGTLTKVGLRTFVDPRQQGGKINARTTEDLVRLMRIDDEEWLFYKAFPFGGAASVAPPRPRRQTSRWNARH
jgi:propionate CoA-transferase